MSTKFVNGDNLKQAIEYLENGTLLVANTNMAPAYDNTKAYSTGEVVSYQTLIYEWIADAPAGTSPTNTSYAREISLAELTANLQTKIESGAVVANQAKSSFAINPVSAESGTEQDAPFISQGTGTANNTASVDVPPVAQHLEKQGYTVVENQWFNIASVTNTTVDGVTFSKQSGNKIKLNGTSSAAIYKYTYLNQFKSGNKYLFIMNGFSSSNCYLSDQGGHSIFGNNTAIYQTGIYTATGNGGDLRFTIPSGRTFSDAIIEIVGVFDLTQYFGGNSNIPSDLLSNPSHWSWYYNGTGAYNTGTIRNAPGRYLVTTGRNLFNSAIVSSGTLEVDGTVSSSSSYKTSDYILITPNRDYYISAIGSTRIKFYDRNKTPLRTDAYDVTIAGNSADTFTASANAIYVRFTIINNRVASTDFSLYYSPEEGGEGYDEHYAYEEPHVYDTGTEELLFLDTKDPDGTWHKNTGIVNLGDLTWYSTTDHIFYNSPASQPIVKTETVKMIMSNGKYTPNAVTYISDDKVIYASSNGIFWIHDNNYTDVATFKASLSNVYLEYEVKNPTTEQGTPFASNIDDNDYGMMYWLDTDGNLVSTPQGCKIFYPFDYVLGLDTLFGYTSGDMTDLVRKSDIATQEEIDEILAILQ